MLRPRGQAIMMIIDIIIIIFFFYSNSTRLSSIEPRSKLFFFSLCFSSPSVIDIFVLGVLKLTSAVFPRIEVIITKTATTATTKCSTIWANSWAPHSHLPAAAGCIILTRGDRCMKNVATLPQQHPICLPLSSPHGSLSRGRFFFIVSPTWPRPLPDVNKNTDSPPCNTSCKQYNAQTAFYQNPYIIWIA